MAKVSNKRTASNRKTAGSVNSSKKTGRKGLLGKSFNLQSRKVQFFVVIAIVALLGGGWFTYRSFASTANVTFSKYNAPTSPIAPQSSSNKAGQASLSYTMKSNKLYSSEKLRVHTSGHYAVCAMVRRPAHGADRLEFVISDGKSAAQSRVNNKGTISLVNTPHSGNTMKSADFWRNCNGSRVFIPAGTDITLSIKPLGGAANILYTYLEHAPTNTPVKK